MRLLVTEKPSVARDWARLLQARKKIPGGLCNDTLVITWCIGHVAQIADPGTHNGAWRTWRLNTLPMLPESFILQPNPATAKHFFELKNLLLRRDIREVINGCDAGREGELIFRYAYTLAGCTKPVLRLWLSSMTDTAMRRAWAQLVPARAYDALADAARCRSEADWLVGLNATRALTLARRRSEDATLYTVGRVQTPTLAMLVQREQTIETFEPEPFWQVTATFHTPEAQYDGLYVEQEAPASDAKAEQSNKPADRAGGTTGRCKPRPADKTRISSAERAADIARATRGQPGRVLDAEMHERVEPPPLLYDLTGLQRAANVRFGMRATDTLDAAQALYEKHKALTYPRTDSNYLTRDMGPGLAAVLEGLARGPLAEHVRPLLQHAPVAIPGRIIKNSEVGDHHAIIPTGRVPDMSASESAERRIFDLVSRRFVAAFYPPAIYALATLRTRVGEHVFISRGRVCKQAGWQVVEPPPPRPKSATDPAALPGLAADTVVWSHETRVDARQTQPPPRFSEARLLAAMERAGADVEDAELRMAMKDSGLGTPATRAAIIENLHRRAFVRRDQRTLVPTARGRALIAALPNNSLTRADLTGAWEARLTRVARGTLSAEEFMRDVRTFTQSAVRDIVALAPSAPATGDGTKAKPARATRSPARVNIAALLCPLCRRGHMMAGRAAWGCDRWRSGCTFVVGYTCLKRQLAPKDLRSLLKRGHTAAVRGIGRLVLDLAVPGYVRAESATVRPRKRNRETSRGDKQQHAQPNRSGRTKSARRDDSRS